MHRTSFAVAVWVMLAGSALAQQDLIEKLRDLRIRHSTAHYELAGTIEQSRLTHYGEALEFIYREYAAGFARLLDEPGNTEAGPGAAPPQRQGQRPPTARRPPTRPAPGARRTPGTARGDADAVPDASENRHRVIIFARRQEYEEFSRLYVGGPEYTTGMFIPAAELLLILDDADANRTYETLFHEAFHQFVRRYIKNPPMWLNEGLATHYGHARPSGNGLKFIRSNRLDLLKATIADRRAIPLFDVVTAERFQFYDGSPFPVTGYGEVPRSAVYYAEASTLVQMLIADPGGLKRLQNYIRELAASDGTRNHQITEKYFNEATCDGLAAKWARFVDTQ